MKTNLNINVYQSRNQKIFGHFNMLGYGIIALQMLGVMKKQNVRDLNLHKPRILTQKSNDIFKCGSSFKLKLINHLSF
jgi:hypothetical protein